MQSSEGGSDSSSSVALRTSTSAQAPVVQPVPASQQVNHYTIDKTVPSFVAPGQLFSRVVRCYKEEPLKITIGSEQGSTAGS